VSVHSRTVEFGSSWAKPASTKYCACLVTGMAGDLHARFARFPRRDGVPCYSCPPSPSSSLLGHYGDAAFGPHAKAWLMRRSRGDNGVSVDGNGSRVEVSKGRPVSTDSHSNNLMLNNTSHPHYPSPRRTRQIPLIRARKIQLP
jgi:hypothetical protein